VHGGYAIIYSLIESGDTAGDGSNSLGFSMDTPCRGSRVAARSGAFKLDEGPSTSCQPLGAQGRPPPHSAVRLCRFQREADRIYAYVQQWKPTLQPTIAAQWVVSAGLCGQARAIHLYGR